VKKREYGPKHIDLASEFDKKTDLITLKLWNYNHSFAQKLYSLVFTNVLWVMRRGDNEET
jgi:hypothetical protein